MNNPWVILAVLFGVRMTMAFQFQTIGALSPVMMQTYDVGLVELGFLIGLYMSPGLVVALPGGAVARIFGDKRTVLVGLGLMLIGALCIAVTTSWSGQIVGRLFAGTGGVIINVVMTKMVTDWFPKGNLATAMGIYVTSWPFGIALALLVLPSLEGVFGLVVTFWGIATLIAAAVLTMAMLYRAPDTVVDISDQPTGQGLRGPALTCMILAGWIWGLYNAALAVIFSFGPLMLIERGWEEITASTHTSLVLWLLAAALPLGGVLADRTGKRDLVLAISLGGFGLAMLALAFSEHTVVLLVLCGLAGALPAGPIMSLPAEVLTPQTRAMGLGLFFTLYYLAMFVMPVPAGYLSDLGGSVSLAFAFGGVMLGVCLAMLLAFRRLAPTVRSGAVG